MKLISLTDQEYDNLIKSNSLDDFLRFKETLVNSQVPESQVNNSLTIVKDHYSKIAIRVLSLDEYNKYIINGTADGAIIEGNQNTWNFINNTSKASVFIYGAHAFHVNDSDKNRFKGTNYIDNIPINWIVVGNKNRNQSMTDSTSCYFEILSNNKTNIFNCTTKTYPIFECLSGAYEGQSYLENPGGTLIKPVKISTSQLQQATKNSQVYTIQCISNNPSYNNKITLNINMYFMFRPVFIIKDTNKSINLYS